jgi:hypothetical protein
LRKIDPSGVNADQIITDATLRSQIASLTTGATGKLTFKLDASICGANCDYTLPSEFKVSFYVYCNTAVYTCTPQTWTKTFPILKIRIKSSLSYTAATTTYNMPDAFISNFDTVASTSYNWLKGSGCSYTFACTNVSVLQAIASYNYCSMSFVQSTSDATKVDQLDYS